MALPPLQEWVSNLTLRNWVPVLLGALIVAAFLLQDRSPTPPAPPVPISQAERDSLIRDAFLYLLKDNHSKDFLTQSSLVQPDGSYLLSTDPVRIPVYGKKEPRPFHLPEIPGFRFTIPVYGSLQDTADKRGESVWFLALDRLAFERRTAVVGLHVSVLDPTGTPRQMDYGRGGGHGVIYKRRTDGTWEHRSDTITIY